MTASLVLAARTGHLTNCHCELFVCPKSGILRSGLEPWPEVIRSSVAVCECGALARLRGWFQERAILFFGERCLLPVGEVC